MTPIPVDYIMRADFREVGGGDVAQIRNGLASIADRVDARFLPFSAAIDVRAGAICHIVNIDRPLDFMSAVRQARGPVVVSAIHHSLPRMRLMAQAGGSQMPLAFLPFFLRERIAFTRRAVRAADRLSAASLCRNVAPLVLDPRAIWPALGQTLDRVDTVALLAEQERRDIMADSGWSGNNGTLIPNGLPPAGPPPAPWVEREVGIVVVGRIEIRKRQLEIAQAAERLAIPVRFIGPATDTPYGAAFRAFVANANYCEWVGPQSPVQTVAMIADARVLLNASWVEVQSLVDIEAAINGCWVVTAPSGGSQEWLGATVRRIESDDPTALLQAAHALATGDAAPPPSGYRQQWSDVGENLLEIYSRLSPRVAPPV